MKNIYIVSFLGNSDYNAFFPVLWPSSKTFYELNYSKIRHYNWVLPTIEFLTDIDDIKKEISKNPPDIFGVSLYVWNFEISLEICKWVKETYPKCLIITGGPHQYFKHNLEWFKLYDFVDASLPSDAYGEIAIFDILENINEDNSIDWNRVERIAYPSKKRGTVLYSPKATYKLMFDWDYPAFESQLEPMYLYHARFKEIYPNSPIHVKLETTRGCPYECTFCDWGGGVGTKVIKKDLINIYRDIDCMLLFNPSSIYICDANFGINGDRDVEIIKFIADKKKNYLGKVFPNVQYGGFAKTNKHFRYLKDILTVEAESGLSYVYKISIQSFNRDVLKNVKRTDLRIDEHWELSEYLKKNYKYESFIELIIGLPGITVDKWYEEFTIPYDKNTHVRAYEWYLLPEAESYSQEYRYRYKMGISPKGTQSHLSIPNEIVVENNTLSRDGYVENMLAYAAYNLFFQGSIYSESIKDIIEKNDITFGEFLKRFTRKFLLDNESDSIKRLVDHFKSFVSPDINDVYLMVDFYKDRKILAWSYLILDYYENFEYVDPKMQEFLLSLGADQKKLSVESSLIYNKQRLGKVFRRGIWKNKYDKYKTLDEFLDTLDLAFQYSLTELLTGKRTIL